MASTMIRAAQQQCKVITCIVPGGRGGELLEALREEQGVISASVHHARGIGAGDQHRLVHAEERQVLVALVTAVQADQVFEFLYQRAGLAAPHGGMVLMEKALRGVFVSAAADGDADGGSHGESGAKSGAAAS